MMKKVLDLIGYTLYAFFYTLMVSVYVGVPIVKFFLGVL